MLVKSIFLLIASFLLVKAQQKELPDYIEKCSIKHDFKECVLRSANKAIPTIVKGDPKYNAPNMQPLQIPFVNVINTPQLVLNLTDTKVYGLQNAKMVDLIVKNDKELFFIPTFQIPNVTLSGEYSVSGNVLALALNGKGPYTAALLNGVYKYPFFLKKRKINGEDYFQAKGTNTDFELEDVVFDLGNIFNGDPSFGKQVTELLTQNWKALLEEFRPIISNILADIITGILNNIASQVPAKNVFLPD